jgi:glycosyltransferase involved in cell wall biosynthesis
MLDEVLERASEFDVIHSHIDYLPFPVFQRLGLPALTTLHGRLDLPDLRPVFARFGRLPLISISNAQREPAAHANWVATVYHGLPDDLYRLNEIPSDYLVFVGRISPEKRVDRAIEIAHRTGTRLVIAAKIAAGDQEYFEQKIRPLLSQPGIEFIGEVNEFQKQDLLGNARALLFPIDWPEPFGLAMIEAMACGTPVIAYNHGSVPEVIDHGVTGFIVDGVDSGVEAVRRLDSIDRRVCRNRFEERFTSTRMARDYVVAYSLLTGAEGRPIAEVPTHANRTTDPATRTVLHPRDFGTRT